MNEDHINESTDTQGKEAEELAKKITLQAEPEQAQTQTETKNADFQEIYLGPNLRKNGILFGMVFLNGLPFNVQEAVNNCPAIGKLIVDIDKCEYTRARIKTAGTPEYVYYEKIKKEAK